MKTGIVSGIVAVVVVLALIVGYASVFTVYQTQQALVVRLGDPKRIVTEPGLHFKVPLVDNVIYVDKRILDLENPAQEVIAADQKRLVVDAFARYKITDPLRFYQAVNSVDGANSRLATLLNAALRRVLGEATLTHVVRDERAELMGRVQAQLDREAKAFGINVIDVRIRRADLPEQNSQAVYQRMQTERQREAAEFRAQGSQRAQEIRARADRDVTVLVAEATSQAEQTRGEGDATRNRIFAEAFGKDPDFFTFYRSMQAYEAGMKPGDTRFLLRPDSEFFRYFGGSHGRQGAAAAAPSSAPSSAPARTTGASPAKPAPAGSAGQASPAQASPAPASSAQGSPAPAAPPAAAPAQ
ncbi:HflC protein [Rhodovulum sp. PH10]|uniref:protease modulator HflC n=1 Tax=Rhodovulum sp. PH10 TaxID=1187851 RepID=UPI00027C2947|nr:protease modulator HflC [Rhodovulum sp. PH10]EJW11211.1 HflC protein [Rhodovulum sp. PH10]